MFQGVCAFLEVLFVGTHEIHELVEVLLKLGNELPNFFRNISQIVTSVTKYVRTFASCNTEHWML